MSSRNTPTRTSTLNALTRLGHQVNRFSTNPGDRSARLAYLDDVRHGVQNGNLADDPDVAPGHRTYRGIATWVERSMAGLEMQGYNRIIAAANKMI